MLWIMSCLVMLLAVQSSVFGPLFLDTYQNSTHVLRRQSNDSVARDAQDPEVYLDSVFAVLISASLQTRRVCDIFLTVKNHSDLVDLIYMQGYVIREPYLPPMSFASNLQPLVPVFVCGCSFFYFGID